MSTLHDLMGSSIDERELALGAADAARASETRGLIGRHRRRNAAMAGGSSALAVGALVAAGIVQKARVDDAPASVDPKAIEYVEVPPGYQSDDGTDAGDIHLECGAVLPESSASLDGFSQTVTLTGDPMIDQDHQPAVLSSVFTYDGPDHAPVFIEAGYAVLVKDGVVVGEFSPGYYASEVPLTPLTAGELWRYIVGLHDVQPCSADALANTRDPVAFAAGDYEVYMISQAHVAEPEVALIDLTSSGDELAPQGYGNWAPGSVDCQRQAALHEELDFPLLLECEPDALPDTVINTDTGVARLPYAAANYSEDVSVTLVSDAIPFTITDDITWEGTGNGLGSEELNTAVPADLACGVTFDWVEQLTSLTGRIEEPSVDDLLAGATVGVYLDTRGGISRGTATVPSRSSAWLMSRDSNGVQMYVVGQATVELLPSGTVTIDRWAGYPEASMRLSDVSWCGAAAADVTSVVVMGAVTITGDAPTETGEAFEVNVSEWPW